MNPFFLKDADGKPLTLYRGECSHPNQAEPFYRMRRIYFGSLRTAEAYADTTENDGNYYTSRIFPVHLTIANPFINQPKDAFLELEHLIATLGSVDAQRIALRFSKYIEETDNWAYEVNPNNKYNSVKDYLLAGGDITKLYFQAYRFFDSVFEIRRLIQAGYDGAIHAGCGRGSEGEIEYCVFNRAQVYFKPGKTFWS